MAKLVEVKIDIQKPVSFAVVKHNFAMSPQVAAFLSRSLVQDSFFSQSFKSCQHNVQCSVTPIPQHSWSVLVSRDEVTEESDKSRAEHPA